jgi:hypothetical protein
MLTYGADKNCTKIVMLKVSNEDIASVKGKTGSDPIIVRMGPINFLPLLPDTGMKPGQLDAKYYNPEKKAWNDTVAIMKYK